MPYDIPDYTPSSDGRMNQWADLIDPNSYHGREIRAALNAAKPLPWHTITQVESYAVDIFRKVGKAKTVEYVMAIFIGHSDETRALYEEIERFYLSQGIAEENVRWFLVKEIIRILMASAAAGCYSISHHWLTRAEFEDYHVRWLPAESE